MTGDPRSVEVLPIHRNEVLGAGEDEDIRVVRVQILWEPLIRLPSDSRKGKAPPEAERAVAGAGLVGERELRAESRAARRYRDRHGHGAGAGDGIGGELLAHAADGAAALRERDLRHTQ